MDSHVITFHFVYYDQYSSLNSKLKFKTILINKLQLLLRALYLEATLPSLRLAAEHYSIDHSRKYHNIP